MIFVDYIESDFGAWEVRASSSGITSIGLSREPYQKVNPNPHTHQAKTELLKYFKGDLKNFTCQFDLEGHPPFFAEVWNALLEIPFGKTCSYLDLAIKLENIKAVRAVGMANGKNPVAIMIPCHRVIGSDGSMTGYASGIEIKRRLLALENPKQMGLQAKLFS